MFSRNKINARSQKLFNIFYGGEKEKKKIHVYNISAESVRKALLQQRLISLSLFLSYAFTSTLSMVLQVVYFSKEIAAKCLS